MTLSDRITIAERLAKAGETVGMIVSITGIPEVTARCIRSRVTGEIEFSGLKRNVKDEPS